MPTSRSTKPGTSAPPPRLGPPLIGVVMLTVLVVIIATLPAATVKRFLPAGVRARDFSGTLWHGSAGQLSFGPLDVGAIEWRLHPLSLLALSLSADVHWVKVGFVADATIDLERHNLNLRNLEGDGPIEDLASLGLPPGWRGQSSFKFTTLSAELRDSGPALASAVGDVSVTHVASAQIADGADLGGYVLHMADGSITADSSANAELNDTGGPLELHATLHYAALERTGMLLGTLKARPGAPQALQTQLANLAQLHPPDGEGRLPLELEFTL